MSVIETDKDLAAFARALAMEEAAMLADGIAAQNEIKARELHCRSNRQERSYGADVAEQTKISAQVLDCCAQEARSIASAIRKHAALTAEEKK